MTLTYISNVRYFVKICQLFYWEIQAGDTTFSMASLHQGLVQPIGSGAFWSQTTSLFKRKLTALEVKVQTNVRTVQAAD